MRARTVGPKKLNPMLRTLTIVLMTNPSRGSAFYFDAETASVLVALSKAAGIS
jgi:hypothetical protein